MGYLCKTDPVSDLSIYDLVSLEGKSDSLKVLSEQNDIFIF